MGRSSSRFADAMDDETIAYIQERLQERLELKNDKQYEAADEIRDELSQRLGVTIDDRTQEWNIEVDQFTVVDTDRRSSDISVERQLQTPPPSYSIEEDDINEDDDADDDFNDSFEAVFESESDIADSPASTDEEDLTRFTIPELKEKLRALGLAVSGKKPELIERLLQSSMK
jgi:SAP domain